jgi:hypothetical protein
MNYIEKILIKWCSTEVRIMLERMKERPEDFNYGTGWRKLVEVADDTRNPYTKVERKLIRKYWKECEAQRERKKLLDRIMSETINPTTRESMEDALSRQYTTSLAKSMQATKQAVTTGILTGYNDPNALYGRYDQSTAAQGRRV